jgi:hypothetical protein
MRNSVAAQGGPPSSECLQPVDELGALRSAALAQLAMGRAFACGRRKRLLYVLRSEGGPPMPFDGVDSAVAKSAPALDLTVAAKSLRALELMEGRLQGGRKWSRHFMFREGGRMCLLGANYFGCDLGAGSPADRALEYLARAVEPASRASDWSDRCWIETTITDFNDSCAGYGDIERVLRAAQRLARADIAAAR